MDRNVGPEDRVVRIVAAIMLAVIVYFVDVSNIAQILVWALAAYLLISGLVARCLVYSVLGVDTGIQEQPYSTTDDRAF
jgi:hypothetical protein